MSNLLKQTEEAIRESGRSISDIVFIGSEASGHQCTWDEFCQLANKEYDDGFGAQQVASDLVIVFRDGQKLWRGEYDGSEWWEYSTPFQRPEQSQPIQSLFAGRRIGWVTLRECNSND